MGYVLETVEDIEAILGPYHTLMVGYVRSCDSCCSLFGHRLNRKLNWLSRKLKGLIKAESETKARKLQGPGSETKRV